MFLPIQWGKITGDGWRSTIGYFATRTIGSLWHPHWRFWDARCCPSDWCHLPVTRIDFLLKFGQDHSIPIFWGIIYIYIDRSPLLLVHKFRSVCWHMLTSQFLIGCRRHSCPFWLVHTPYVWLMNTSLFFDSSTSPSWDLRCLKQVPFIHSNSTYTPLGGDIDIDKMWARDAQGETPFVF